MSSKSTSLHMLHNLHELAMELDRFDAVPHSSILFNNSVANCGSFSPSAHARDFFYFICSSIIPYIRILPPFPKNNDVVMTHFMWLLRLQCQIAEGGMHYSENSIKKLGYQTLLNVPSVISLLNLLNCFFPSHNIFQGDE